jgi:hypothetical protein
VRKSVPGEYSSLLRLFKALESGRAINFHKAHADSIPSTTPYLPPATVSDAAAGKKVMEAVLSMTGSGGGDTTADQAARAIDWDKVRVRASGASTRREGFDDDI